MSSGSMLVGKGLMYSGKSATEEPWYIDAVLGSERLQSRNESEGEEALGL